MAKITDDLRDKILSQYRIGKSQNWLAREYELSTATINKLCKGIEQDYIEKVNTQVAIKSQLYAESEQFSKYFDKEVNDRLLNQGLVYGVTQKALKKLSGMIDKMDNVVDLKCAIEASDRASLTLKVNERHAPKTELKQETNLTNLRIDFE